MRENLYVKDLKKNLQEFVREEVNIDFDKSYFVETINEAPTWLPKANFSRTQTDLIATSPEGVVFDDYYFTNFDLPNIQTENGLVFKGFIIKSISRSIS